MLAVRRKEKKEKEEKKAPDRLARAVREETDPRLDAVLARREHWRVDGKGS